MADPVTERLTAIRATFQPAADILTGRDWQSHDDAWDELGPSGVYQWNTAVAARQVATLVDALEAVLKVAESLEEQSSKVDITIAYGEGHANALDDAAEAIRKAVADALGTDTKETADADS